jgi:hypothetical protein
MRSMDAMDFVQESVYFIDKVEMCANRLTGLVTI